MKLYTRCARFTASVSRIHPYIFIWPISVSDESFRDIKTQIQSNAVINSWRELNIVCIFKQMLLKPSNVRLCLTVRNYLLPQNISRYSRGVSSTDVIITGFDCILIELQLFHGVRGRAVGWGTALQAGKWRVRFPIVSLEFFIDKIIPAEIWHWGRLSL